MLTLATLADPTPFARFARCAFGWGRPFVIDLESANGTTVNDEAVPASRYYELKSGDGQSSLSRLLSLPLCLSLALSARDADSLSVGAVAVIKFAFSTREYVLITE